MPEMTFSKDEVERMLRMQGAVREKEGLDVWILGGKKIEVKPVENYPAHFIAREVEASG